MFKKSPHLNFSIGEGPRLSNMFGLSDTGSRLNMRNIYYHQPVAESNHNLVLKFACLEDMEDMDPFNISGIDGGKETEQGGVMSRCYISNSLPKYL